MTYAEGLIMVLALGTWILTGIWIVFLVETLTYRLDRIYDLLNDHEQEPLPTYSSIDNGL